MTIEPGCSVLIVAGPYSGQTGTVLKIFGDAPESFIKVLTSGWEVLVYRSLLEVITPDGEISPTGHDDTIWGY